MTSQAASARSTPAQTAGAALTPRQLVALYLVLAPLPGGRWLRRLSQRHPEQTALLRDASRVWARAGSKQRAARRLATVR